MACDLLRAWRSVSDSAPYVLPEDRDLLLSPKYSHFVHTTNLDGFLKASDFGTRDKRLHLGLVPRPFNGRIDSAPIVLLCLNPGLSPVDYFAEYRWGLRELLMANLRGRPVMPWFDPDYSWHPGFRYWQTRFGRTVDVLADRFQRSRLETLHFLQKKIAILQLVPYHSASFGLPRSLWEKLHSVQLARSFVADHLIPRARAGEALVVCLRASKKWGVQKKRGVIVYDTPGAVRGAYLHPGTEGGEAIRKRLEAEWKAEQT
jgi:hypothetical protein